MRYQKLQLFALAICMLSISNASFASTIGNPPPAPSLKEIKQTFEGNHIILERGSSNAVRTRPEMRVGSTWQTMDYALNYSQDGVNMASFTDSTVPVGQVRRYRVRNCYFYQASWPNCSDYTEFTAPARVSYPRNTSDSNSNGVRDDAEIFIDSKLVRGSIENTYARHYAYYLTKLKNNPNGKDSDIYNNIYHMASALTCSNQDAIIYDARAIILDNEQDYRNYLEASRKFGLSIYNQYLGKIQCTVPSNSRFGASGYDVSTDEVELDINGDVLNKSTLRRPRIIRDDVLPPQGSRSSAPDPALFNEEELQANFGEDASADTQSSSGAKKRYVIYVNGLFTSPDAGNQNLKKIIDEFYRYNAVEASQLAFFLSYNEQVSPHIDAIEAVQQFGSKPNTNEWYMKALKDMTSFAIGAAPEYFSIQAVAKAYARVSASMQIRQDDLDELVADIDVRLMHAQIVILAHSQGNFFANEAYARFDRRDSLPASRFLRVFGLGVPTSHIGGSIPGKLSYSTNTGDVIINAIRALQVASPLPANVTISGGDTLGHGLEGTYMKTGSVYTTNTIRRIHEMFNDMQPDPFCRGFNWNDGRQEGLTYPFQFQPGHNGWEGTLRYHMASFNGAAYSHSIRDENGLVLLSTGPVYGDLYLDFLYREELNGILTFSTVRHVGPAVDNVGSQLFCLSN